MLVNTLLANGMPVLAEVASDVTEHSRVSRASSMLLGMLSSTA